MNFFELFDAAPPAPPTVGLPWTVGGSFDDPLSSDEPSGAPPQPERHLRDFSELTAAPPEQIAVSSYTPGTPWL